MESDGKEKDAEARQAAGPRREREPLAHVLGEVLGRETASEAGGTEDDNVVRPAGAGWDRGRGGDGDRGRAHSLGLVDELCDGLEDDARDGDGNKRDKNNRQHNADVDQQREHGVGAQVEGLLTTREELGVERAEAREKRDGIVLRERCACHGTEKWEMSDGIGPCRGVAQQNQ